MFSVLFGISSNCQESSGFVFMRDFVFIMPLNTGQQVRAVSAMWLGGACFKQLSFVPLAEIGMSFNQALL